MKYQKDVFRSFTMVLQFGITMLVPILLCTFLGIWLDRKLGTSFIVIILFFLGALAGFTNIFKLVRDSGNTHTYIGSDASSNLKSSIKDIEKAEEAKKTEDLLNDANEDDFDL